MGQKTKKMKSIWYLTSLVLLEMGAIVFIAGIYNIFHPSTQRTMLAHLNPSLWWGLIMILCGSFFYFKNRK